MRLSDRRAGRGIPGRKYKIILQLQAQWNGLEDKGRLRRLTRPGLTATMSQNEKKIKEYK